MLQGLKLFFNFTYKHSKKCVEIFSTIGKLIRFLETDFKNQHFLLFA
jgi:hypothetical protein